MTEVFTVWKVICTISILQDICQVAEFSIQSTFWRVEFSSFGQVAWHVLTLYTHYELIYITKKRYNKTIWHHVSEKMFKTTTF